MLCVESVVVNALSHAIAALDFNDNLALATEPGLEALWFALAEHPNVHDASRTMNGCRMSARINMEPVEVANSGRHGRLRARFPFSRNLIALFEATETREALLEGRSPSSIAVTLLGPELAGMVCKSDTEACVRGRPALGIAAPSRPPVPRYFHDFVSMQSPFAGLDFETHLAVTRSALLAADEGALASPFALHATAVVVEGTVQRVLRLLASPLPASIKATLLATVRASHGSGPNATSVATLRALMRSLWEVLGQPAEAFSRCVAELRPDVEALLVIVADDDASFQLRGEWNGIWLV